MSIVKFPETSVFGAKSSSRMHFHRPFGGNGNNIAEKVGNPTTKTNNKILRCIGSAKMTADTRIDRNNGSANTNISRKVRTAIPYYKHPNLVDIRSELVLLAPGSTPSWRLEFTQVRLAPGSTPRVC
eukprot:TRINITY_DN6603_c0_g1_i1.p1 TRINITY_DN6603_c0_g1~~TRINITY_DN6603_c0_g1_i1.p1  ORF type:complete len:127 (+),score=0.39 TRINITY_DN6603_c0_g1_i1:127-507(+)